MANWTIFCWCGVAAILHVVSAVITSNEPLTKEFSKRQIVVQKLNTTYDQYRATYPQHASERARLLNLFMKLYHDEFNNSDTWILQNMISKSGIVEEFMKINSNHYVKTASFVNSASQLYMDANLQRIRFAVHNKNYSEAERQQTLRQTGIKSLKEKSSATLDYIRNVVYKTQFKEDAMAISQLNPPNQKLPDIVVKDLKEKFPFRTWLAVFYDSSKDHNFCQVGDVFTTRVGSHHLMVFDVAISAQSNTRLASQLLARVDDSRGAGLEPCENRAKLILNQEAKYNCDQKAFRVAGTVESDENGLPRLASSDSKLIISKTVWRARLSWMCRANFKVFFLA